MAERFSFTLLEEINTSWPGARLGTADMVLLKTNQPSPAQPALTLGAEWPFCRSTVSRLAGMGGLQLDVTAVAAATGRLQAAARVFIGYHTM
ncbi:hypothetical protein CFIMG_008049RA00001 [Ceratocystis fimbriata CBS 114723]|uniref:Uncharacterized protein n=1 Tax=Ceratocystis fimbriata CBS 114723 TaxID=1035309 RepID=A0A2C5WYT4_9PEZI|nr:hypothetical protein CFIMG_008049RA00001 [Ceratocystis fimbriata CBS 114723]